MKYGRYRERMGSAGCRGVVHGVAVVVVAALVIAGLPASVGSQSEDDGNGSPSPSAEDGGSGSSDGSGGDSGEELPFPLTGLEQEPVQVKPETGPPPQPFPTPSPGFVGGTSAPLPAPTNLECLVSSFSITIRWDIVDHATGYTAKLQLAVAGSPQTTKPTTGKTSTSVRFDSLLASTRYFIGVFGTQNGVAGRYAGVYCTTLSAPLPAPTDLTCSVASNAISFSWEMVDGATGYTAKLQLAVAGSLQTTEPITGKRNIRFVFTGLSPSTWYYLSVHATKNGVSGYFAGKYCRTGVAVAPPVCSGATSSTVTLRWSTRPYVGTWYAARVVPNARSTDGRSVSAVPSASTQTTLFSRLTANTSYQFDFWWKTDWGSWNQIQPNVTCTTFGPAQCGAITDTTVQLKWNDRTGVYNWFLAKEVSDSTYEDERSLPAATRETVFSNLSPNIEYSFLFRWKASPNGQWTQVLPSATCRTTVAASSLVAPEVDCETVTSDSVTVSWGRVDDAARYRYRTTPGSTDWTTTTAREVAISDLSAFTSHTVEVQPGTAGEWSDNTGTAVCTTISDPVTSGGKYRVLKEVYEGVHHSVSLAVDERPGACGAYSNADAKKRLAAIMLSIPVHEVLGGFTSTGDSAANTVANAAGHPMVLSRSDTLSRADNIRFFSHLKVGDYERAFWNPGVGLWQLDNLNAEVLNQNHAERVDPSQGGLAAAKFILEEFCGDETSYLTKTHARWVACWESRERDDDDIPDCYESYLELYNRGGAFNVHVVDQATSGGIEERKCRWGDSGEEVDCYLFHTNPYSNNEATGCAPSSFWAVTSVHTVSKCSEGTVTSSNLRGFTPLAGSFVSLTSMYMEGPEDDPWKYSTRYAVWPAVWPETSETMVWPTESVASAEGAVDPCLTSGDSCITLIKAVPRGVKSRVSPQGDMNLKVPTNVDKHCSEDLGAARTIPCNRFTAFSGTIKSESNHGPEGWYDDTIDYDNTGTQRDLQVYDCKLVDLTGVQCGFVSVNKAREAATELNGDEAESGS